MDKIVESKRSLELVTSLFQVTKQFQKNSFISSILSDQVWWCKIKRFLSYSKITSANLCKPIHDIIKYSTSIYPFESGKCGKKGRKLQKLEYHKIENSFLDEIKSSFHSFWRAIIWSKNKNLIKNIGQALNSIINLSLSDQLKKICTYDLPRNQV